MIDKAEFYHGAAIIKLLEDKRNPSIKKRDYLCYLVNNIFIFPKYTTKVRSPWSFVFNQEDIDRCSKMFHEYNRVVLVLVCGGDGVCALEWEEARFLLNNKPGRIATGRKHNESYAVWGRFGKLVNKVPIGRWPNIVFKPSKLIKGK